MRRSWYVLMLGLAMVSVASPVSAATPGRPAPVIHNQVEIVTFSDDVCGERANVTTFNRKVVQERSSQQANGAVRYHYTAVVTYVSDYTDPTLPTLSGKLTEVINVVLTPNGTRTETIAFHDFFGDIKIFVRLHATYVSGEPVVERETMTVSGCP